MSLTPRIGLIELFPLGGRRVLTTARNVLLMALFGLLASPAVASEGWLTNYEEALAAAEQTGRPVLTIFTGSDWCPHCRTLENNVLHTETFKEWASDRLVLLMIDLPQHGISAEERKARSRVCVKYGVRIFPSALLIAPDGSKITLQTGYSGQSAVTWVTAMSGHLSPDTPSQPAAIKRLASHVKPGPVQTETQPEPASVETGETSPATSAEPGEATTGVTTAAAPETRLPRR
jgi:thiol-disulfide isomerase/thioredoxin